MYFLCFKFRQKDTYNYAARAIPARFYPESTFAALRTSKTRPVECCGRCGTLALPVPCQSTQTSFVSVDENRNLVRYRIRKDIHII